MSKMNINVCWNEFKLFIIFINYEISRILTVSVFLFSLTISVICSFSIGFSFLLCFILGVYISRKHYINVIDVFCDKVSENESQSSQGCGVCGNANCTRQKPVEDKLPWSGLEIPKEVDQALQDLLNKLLNEFVHSWYGKFSKDELFIYELRLRLRFALSILLRRISKANIGELICQKLIPLGIRHIEDFMVASKDINNGDIINNVGRYLSDRIHPATKSRKTELDYLQCISQVLVRVGLPKEELQCRPVPIFIADILSGWVLLLLSDTLCNPHVLNQLCWLALTYKQTVTSQNGDVQKTQFLKNFVARPPESIPSPLHSNLTTVLQQEHLLYPFMQFLKGEGVVNLLQFCLAVEDYNRRLFVPDLSMVMAEKLHKDALDLFHLYIEPESLNYIHCSSVLTKQLQQTLCREKVTIQQLQTTTPLFDMYEEVFTLLEQTYLPRFYQSTLFFKQISREAKAPIVCSNPSSRLGSPSKSRLPQKKPHEPLVAKLSHKLQKLVQINPVEGSTFYVDTGCDVIDASIDELDLLATEEFRDMSDWEISIPGVIIEQDSGSKPYPVFIIKVVSQREKDFWDVRRKLNDFSMLDAKISEFYKMDECATLKNHGLFAPRGAAFLESKRRDLEIYLRSLLQITELHSSDLLYCFLRSPAEFAFALRSPLSLSSLLRNAVNPISSKKFRGRHLDEFLHRLLEDSIQSNQFEWTSESGFTEIIRYKRCITKSIFGDNFADFFNQFTGSGQDSADGLDFTSIWDCILFFFESILGAPKLFLRLILTVKVAFGENADGVVHSLVNRKLEQLLKPSSLAYLIRLLQGAILTPKKTSTTEEIINFRVHLLNYLTSPGNNFFLKHITPNWSEGLTFIVEVFQHPKLNKHLFYCLLDELFKVLFTEFNVPPINL